MIQLLDKININCEVKMEKTIKGFIMLCIFVIFTGIGVAIMMKVDLGMGVWDATSLTFSYLTGLKLGTVGMVINILCVLLQIIILNKKFSIINLLQVPAAILLGVVINFFGYYFFKDLVVTDYWLKIVLCILMTIFIAFNIAGIVALRFLMLPPEGLCLAISTKWNIPFAKVRQWLDYVCVIIIIVFTLIFSIKWSIREAAIISALLFSRTLGYLLPKIEKFYEKTGLI